MTENRVKIFSVDQEVLIDFFNWFRYPRDVVHLPIIDALPEDAKVVNVDYNFETRRFDVMASSEKFEPVACAVPAPRVEGPTEYRAVNMLDYIKENSNQLLRKQFDIVGESCDWLNNKLVQAEAEISRLQSQLDKACKMLSDIYATEPKQILQQLADEAQELDMGY